jgi:oligoendopeptidase F
MEVPVRPQRQFVPEDFVIDSWSALEPYFVALEDRPITSKSDLERWMRDRSELEAVLEEDMAWRYIKMNIDTTDKQLAADFQFFVEEIEPHMAPFGNRFNTKLVESTFVDQLEGDAYFILLRKTKEAISLYREENIPLLTRLQSESQKFGAISAAMSIEHEQQQLTMQQAGKLLKETDRALREEIYRKIKARRGNDREALDALYSELIKLRQQVAVNAGFSNFRDYKFVALSRFDYTKEDCFDFHESIAKEIVPIINDFDRERREQLALSALKPWDTQVDPSGKIPLKPFTDGEELCDKAIACFDAIRPSFGRYLRIMKTMKHLDLDSKSGKAPGGFNYPLYEIGVPFIYMNAVGSLRDVVTMVHEGGHAIHSFLSKELELVEFKDLPSEVAELASMSMELISMEHWEVFFNDEEELRRAKKEQLQQVLETLPWVAQIDKFQHWVYENPEHTLEERKACWLDLNATFGSAVIDWNGEEDALANSWQKQLHLYEVPFYYIEYGMAQLGAIAVWRNYKRNPQQALDQYEAALQLGYTKSIGEIYKTAGVRFDFSLNYVKDLAQFVRAELAKL